MHVTGVGPGVGHCSQAASDWVLGDVTPLFRVALRCAQDVIEKTVLPQRWWFLVGGEQAFGGPFFPTLHKLGERFDFGQCDAEKVHVIWHDHITTDAPAVAGIGGLPFGEEEVVSRVVCEKRRTLLRAGGDEVNGSFDPNIVQASQVDRSFGCRPDRWSGGLV